VPTDLSRGLEPLPRRRARRVPTMVGRALVVAAAGTGGTLIAAKDAIDSVQRVPEIAEHLSASSPNVENFLFVGSDSREGADPNDPDYGGIGSETDVSGRRSDTMMILRHDRETGAVSLLSIPRDLWVDVPGRGNTRINSAYNEGPEVLVQTIIQELGIPIHHYVEVDFSGFKNLVDAVGGVELCLYFPTRDTHTGFNYPEPGCRVVDGVQALAYARSRHYERFINGSWEEDPTADIGRTKRQREFVKIALQRAVDEIKANPFIVGDVMRKGGASIRIDDELDLVDAASRLRDAVEDIATYSLPVKGVTIDGNAVLQMTPDADAVLAFFRGEGPAPQPDA
jgi:LCP family protein required for cell wall assembly